MKHLFYFIGLFPFVWEIYKITHTKKVSNYKKEMDGKKFDEWDDTQKTFAIMTLGYVMWMFIGLLSSQWAVFLFLILFGFTGRIGVFFKRLDAFLSAAGILFLILNAYHLHIDLFELIKNIFS